MIRLPEFSCILNIKDSNQNFKRSATALIWTYFSWAHCPTVNLVQWGIQLMMEKTVQLRITMQLLIDFHILQWLMTTNPKNRSKQISSWKLSNNFLLIPISDGKMIQSCDIIWRWWLDSQCLEFHTTDLVTQKLIYNLKL